MLDFQSIYRRAEEHIRLIIMGIFALLVLLIAAQSFFSGLLVLFGVAAVLFAAVTVVRPLWTLAFLALYLPFESFLLKFVTDDVYVFARFFSEILIYILAAVVLWRVVSGRFARVKTSLDLPFFLLLVAITSSALVNAVDPTVAALGARHLLRFVIVFFVAVQLRPPREYVKRLTIALLAVVALQGVLGVAQAVIGAPLDEVLFPSQARTLGEITLTSGVEQFWDPGSRVFGTFGRYDRLGNFLYVFLLIAVALCYEKKAPLDRRELFGVLALGLVALVLTFSRASWFAFILGFLFLAFMKKDRRVALGAAAVLIAAIGYLGLSGLQVRYIIEGPGQTLVERFYETFSFARWRGEYVGLGRVYWFVQTPMRVIPASPIFGFGTGQYGGGVVAALRQTRVYERLGLPFGVYGTEGFIDNSWFSLW